MLTNIKRVAGHFLIAGLVAPYFLGFVLTAAQPGSFSRDDALVILLGSPIVLMVFGLIIIVPFAIISFPLAYKVGEITAAAKRRRFFCGIGAAIGLLFGALFSLPSGDFHHPFVVIPGGAIVGCLAGCLESLLWNGDTEVKAVK
jgi:hypothetical protein